MIIEGAKDILEVFKSHPEYSLKFLWHRKALDNFYFKDIEKIANLRGTVTQLTDREFKGLRKTVHSQGMFLVLNIPQYTLADIIKKEFIVFLNGIQDPGNLGAIIRSAALLGVEAIVTDSACVRLNNPKVLRASKGYFCDIPIVENIEIRDLTEFELVAADTDLDQSQSLFLENIEFQKPLCLVFGSEGQGVSVKTDKKIYIPMAKQGGSLNVAIAAGIILFEVSKKWRLNKN
ncbi:MAG: RNA methyltransferase [bacterium]|nr:RNA methyltransferase [bacterium]